MNKRGYLDRKWVLMYFNLQTKIIKHKVSSAQEDVLNKCCLSLKRLLLNTGT